MKAKINVAIDGILVFTITYLGGEHQVFGDYSVTNPVSGGSYKVALRDKNPGPSFLRKNTVLSMDIPWNPAVLEQRIGRVHRHGQKRNVTVINLISKDSIEERMLEVLKFKSSLFAGTFADGADEIFIGEDRFRRFMSTVAKITDVPQTPPLITDVEIEEVSETGKPYLKIPIANEQVIVEVFDAFKNLLSVP